METGTSSWIQEDTGCYGDGTIVVTNIYFHTNTHHFALLIILNFKYLLRRVHLYSHLIIFIAKHEVNSGIQKSKHILHLTC